MDNVQPFNYSERIPVRLKQFLGSFSGRSFYTVCSLLFFSVFFVFLIDPLPNLEPHQWFCYPQSGCRTLVRGLGSLFSTSISISLSCDVWVPGNPVYCQSIYVCQHFHLVTTFPDHFRGHFKVCQCPKCCLRAVEILYCSFPLKLTFLVHCEIVYTCTWKTDVCWPRG